MAPWTAEMQATPAAASRSAAGSKCAASSALSAARTGQCARWTTCRSRSAAARGATGRRVGLGKEHHRSHRAAPAGLHHQPAGLSAAKTSASCPARAKASCKDAEFFQDPYASLNPKIASARSSARPCRRTDCTRARARRTSASAELLDTVGLRPEHASRFPHEFSGGQRQRRRPWRARWPSSPSSSSPTRGVGARRVRSSRRSSTCWRAALADRVFISHRKRPSRYLCERVVVLYLGHVMEVAPTAELFERPLHPYTQALLAASPKPDPLVASVAVGHPQVGGPGRSAPGPAARTPSRTVRRPCPHKTK